MKNVSLAYKRMAALSIAGSLLILSVIGCGLKKEVQIAGRTMGTTYHVKVVTGFFSRASGLEEKIERTLKDVNQSMSVHISDSEISRFNAIGAVDQPFEASEGFWYVMKVSEKIYQQTGGAWDGTLFPLIRLWKFNTGAQEFRVPAPEEITGLLPEVGFRHIRFQDGRTLSKQIVPLSVDLSSIAKGYGVDRVVHLLKGEGFQDFLVEIGGEVYAAGRRKDGERWRVGINVPDKDAPLDAVYRVVTLENQALATSGNYRNFFEAGGKRYSHIFDPRTGYPVSNSVVSVSILADTCTLADGLATGVIVMGSEKGLELIHQMGVEGLIVTQSAGSLTDHPSRGFKASP
jgi:FAD:protein FMN transferase